MFKNCKIHGIFPTPIIHFKFKDHLKHNFNFTKITQEVKKPETWVLPLHTSFPNISNKDIVINKKELNNLKKDIKKNIDIVFEEINLPKEYIISNIWYNLYTNNQGQEAHDHLSTLYDKQPYWSGIYYYKNSSPTVFYRPDKLHKFQNFQTNSESKLHFFYIDNWFPLVEDGDIVLFPSYLTHGTLNRNQEKRITFAFNLLLK
jgi:hypothetical protein